MKDFDFSGLSVEELQQIKERIGKEIESKLDQGKKTQMTQMAEIVNSIKNYVKNYGVLTIESEYYNNGLTLQKEDSYHFFPGENLIIIK